MKRLEINLGDIARLRKKHPCGSSEWEIVRVGAVVGIECLGCHRRVLLERSLFERRVKAFLPKQPQNNKRGFGVDSSHPSH